jgi:hypothetical protein
MRSLVPLRVVGRWPHLRIAIDPVRPLVTIAFCLAWSKAEIDLLEREARLSAAFFRKKAAKPRLEHMAPIVLLPWKNKSHPQKDGSCSCGKDGVV